RRAGARRGGGGLGAVAVVGGGAPPLLALAVGGQRRLAGGDALGKLTAPGDDARLLHVAHREAAESLEEEALPGLDPPRERARRHPAGDVEPALRLGEPAPAPVGEGDVPLVPDALLPLVLEPADDVVAQAAHPAVAPQRDARAGGDEVRHLPHRLEVLPRAHDDGAAVAADGGPRRPELEFHRGAAVRATALARRASGHG